MNKENFLKNFESLFGSQYLVRGKEYYSEGLVTTLLREGNIINAKVQGNNLYKVGINLNSGKMDCTCPCDFNCKHMAVVLYALKDNKATEVEKLFAGLEKKSIKELQEMIKKMILEYPALAIYINPDESNLTTQKKSPPFMAGFEEDFFSVDGLRHSH